MQSKLIIFKKAVLSLIEDLFKVEKECFLNEAIASFCLYPVEMIIASCVIFLEIIVSLGSGEKSHSSVWLAVILRGGNYFHTSGNESR